MRVMVLVKATEDSSWISRRRNPPRPLIERLLAMAGYALANPPYELRDTFSKRLISRSRLRRDSRLIQNRPLSRSISG